MPTNSKGANNNSPRRERKMAIEQKVLKAILMLRKLGNKSQTKEE